MLIAKTVFRHIVNHQRLLLLLLMVQTSIPVVFAQNLQIHRNQTLSVLVDTTTAPVVQTAFQLLQHDFLQVLNVKLVLATTSDNSQIVVRQQSGGTYPEAFHIKVQGGKVTIDGSDALGVAYGMLEISRMIGVSPWEWWADVVPEQLDGFTFKEGYEKDEHPSVRYRGFFINDEDWGLKPWASKTFEPELNDIGPKTYGKVCELLLRLRGNMLAPAMHTCTGAFYTHPENKIVADRYGIMITTSHCEPLLLNNASKKEWNPGCDGDWNYTTNKEMILAKMEARVREASPYRNIYTMAMRGIHDEGLRGNMPMGKRVEVITDVISEQRRILRKYLPSFPDVPQIFVPYKECLDIYENGLQVPEDITLVWPDDNYGYMKRLSNPEEQKRSGHSGVYYHVSYLGVPHDYLWLSTTAPMLMYEELRKAFHTGADRYWLLNVGDIKPAELDIQTFFDIAWDINAVSYDNVNGHQSQMLANIFGKQYHSKLQHILDQYYKLAWIRKPEFMGGERELDTPQYADLQDTPFSFDAPFDAQDRLLQYKEISDISYDLYRRISPRLQPAFFQLVLYPVLAAHQMNRKFLMAQLNHVTSSEWAAQQAIAANDSINALTQQYNSLLDGKWKHFMTVPSGIWAKYQNMPKLTRGNTANDEKAMAIADKTPSRRDSRSHAIDLTAPESGNARILRGIGYDWDAVQLGEATETTHTPAYVTYDIGRLKSDSITLHIWSVPLFPLYKGLSNRYAVSIDNGEKAIMENVFTEFDTSWKDQVICNGKEMTVTLPLDKKQRKHTLTLTGIDPGQIIQRITYDTTPAK